MTLPGFDSRVCLDDPDMGTPVLLALTPRYSHVSWSSQLLGFDDSHMRAQAPGLSLLNVKIILLLRVSIAVLVHPRI